MGVGVLCYTMWGQLFLTEMPFPSDLCAASQESIPCLEANELTLMAAVIRERFKPMCLLMTNSKLNVSKCKCHGLIDFLNSFAILNLLWRKNSL